MEVSTPDHGQRDTTVADVDRLADGIDALEELGCRGRPQDRDRRVVVDVLVVDETTLGQGRVRGR